MNTRSQMFLLNMLCLWQYAAPPPTPQYRHHHYHHHRRKAFLQRMSLLLNTRKSPVLSLFSHGTLQCERKKQGGSQQRSNLQFIVVASQTDGSWTWNWCSQCCSPGSQGFLFFDKMQVKTRPTAPFSQSNCTSLWQHNSLRCVSNDIQASLGQILQTALDDVLYVKCGASPSRHFFIAPEKWQNVKTTICSTIQNDTFGVHMGSHDAPPTLFSSHVWRERNCQE